MNDSSRPLRDFGLALTTLTVVPIPVAWPARGVRPDVAGWYPVVGLLIGGLQWAMLTFLPGGGARGWAIALLAVGLPALLTRGLHWDGLADVADAFGAHEREARLEIMKDSRIGTFGALAICFALGAEVASFTSLADAGVVLPVIVAATTGRFAATFSAWIGSPARPDGLGASVCRRPGWGGVAAFLLALCAVGWLAFGALGLPGVYLVGGGLAAALVVPDLVARRFGGVTGDTMGASIMLCEVIVLSLAVAAWGA